MGGGETLFLKILGLETGFPKKKFFGFSTFGGGKFLRGLGGGWGPQNKKGIKQRGGGFGGGKKGAGSDVIMGKISIVEW
ncbi:MAG: hypothetical protein CM15mV129_010 [uncultured marine virus]|nr:MAG: hypothetical protein CM15mV129_010 [uncultured marine virus]